MAIPIKLSFEDIEKYLGKHLHTRELRDKWNALKEAVMVGDQEKIKKTVDDFERHLIDLLSAGRSPFDLKTKLPIYWLARGSLLKSDHRNSHGQSDASATRSNEPTMQMQSISVVLKKIDCVMGMLELETRRPDASGTIDAMDECVSKLNAIIETVQGIPRRYQDLSFLLQKSLEIKRMISQEASMESQTMPENATIDDRLNLLKRTIADIFDMIDAKWNHYKKIYQNTLENRHDEIHGKDEWKQSKPNKEVSYNGENQNIAKLRQEIAMLEDKEKSLTVALQRMEADKNYWMNRHDERHVKDEWKQSKPNKEVSYNGENQNIAKLRQEIAMLEDKEKSLTVALQRMEADKNYWMNRVSQEAGAKMKHNNPGITDLSDANRPQKLAEQYGELYDNQWTEALEGLTKSKTMKDESAVDMLCKILMHSYVACQQYSQKQIENLEERLLTTDKQHNRTKTSQQSTNNEQSDRIACRKALRDAQRSVSSTVRSVVVNELILELQKKFSKDKPKKQIEMFMKSSIKLCWSMVVQDPPLHFLYPACGKEHKIDSDSFTFYTRSGEFTEYVVWPAMLLHKDGPVLRKGVVQPYLVKK